MDSRSGRSKVTRLACQQAGGRVRPDLKDGQMSCVDDRVLGRGTRVKDAGAKQKSPRR